MTRSKFELSTPRKEVQNTEPRPLFGQRSEEKINLQIPSGKIFGRTRILWRGVDDLIGVASQDCEEIEFG
jgi:hypothetical protein